MTWGIMGGAPERTYIMDSACVSHSNNHNIFFGEVLPRAKVIYATAVCVVSPYSTWSQNSIRSERFPLMCCSSLRFPRDGHGPEWIVNSTGHISKPKRLFFFFRYIYSVVNQFGWRDDGGDNHYGNGALEWWCCFFFFSFFAQPCVLPPLCAAIMPAVCFWFTAPTDCVAWRHLMRLPTGYFLLT